MIKVTKLGGNEVIINADLIESIAATPDTVITLTTNKKILVKDDVEEVVNKVIAYRQQLLTHLTVNEE